MKLWLRVAIGLVALVVVAAIALAIAVAVLFEPRDYQPLLVEAVQKNTGRTLTLDDDLGLDLFPCCSVTLGRTALGNPPGFPEAPFARVQSAALSLRVWPLITRREVEIGSVALDGLDVSLLRTADGRTNWEFGESEAAPEGEGEAAASGVSSLRIAGLDIREGRIAYRDEQDKSDYTAANIRVETGGISPGEPFSLTAALKLTDNADGTVAKLDLKSTATVAGDGDQITLAKPLLEVSASGPQIPAKTLTATFGAKSLAITSQETTRFAFENLESDFKLAGLQAVKGELAGSAVTQTATVESGERTEFATPELKLDVEIQGEDIPGHNVSATATTRGVTVDLDELRGGAQALEAEVNGLGASLAVTGSGRFQESGANMSGSLKLAPVSPRGLLAVLDERAPETADPKALTKLSGTADWTLKKKAAGFEKLDFQLDDTRIRGRAGVRNFDEPTITFNLRLDAIDLDRYLEPDEAQSVGGGDAGAEAPVEIPVETIRDLRLDGELGIARLTLAKAKLSDVSAVVKAAGGRLRLDPLSARLYGGEYRGAVMVDATGERARVTAEQQLTGVQVGGVLRDLYDTGRLTGALTGRVSATGTGNTDAALLKSLDGSVSLNLADGVYQGMDVWHEIRNARARLRGNPPLPAPKDPQTPINALELAGNMKNGVLRSERLLAEIPFLRVTGGGGLDLAGETLDYTLQAKVFEKPVFPDGGNLDDLTGLTIPLTIKGPMDGPKVGVDMKNLAKDAAIQKGRQKLLERLGLEEITEGEATTDQQADQQQPAQPPPEEKPRDALKRGLRDLLKP
jgi:AsmA protein